MKKLSFIICIVLFFGCKDPYWNPDVSKATSAVEQLQQITLQTELLKEQNMQLKRIADALEKQNK